MMNYRRLTQRLPNGDVRLIAHKVKTISLKEIIPIHAEIAMGLGELEDKLESGRLMELPCKVGDIVLWRNGMICGGRAERISIEIDEDGVTGYIQVSCSDYVETFSLENFNKDWFLSEQDLLAAETRLSKMRE